MSLKIGRSPRHGDEVVPAIVAEAGDHASRRFLEFFAATIRNQNTRAAYSMPPAASSPGARPQASASSPTIEPLHVAAYIEALGKDFEKPTVKQHLAAIRMLFDWLVVGQVVAINPAHAVRGPKHVVKRGKTPVLDADEARKLLDSIDATTLVGLRDRALIARDDLQPSRASAPSSPCASRTTTPRASAGGSGCTRKAASATKCRRHHNLEAYLDAYIEAAGIRDDGKSSPLPLRRWPHRRADRKADEPRRRLAHDPAPRRRRSARAPRSAATRSARPASRPISKPAARSKMRRPWRRTKARARQSSMIAQATRSRLMRSSGLRFSRTFRTGPGKLFARKG